MGGTPCSKNCITICVKLDEDLKKKVKKKILREWGLKNTGLTRAANEAFRLWLKQPPKRKKR
jgi:hypothetical protein